MCIRDGAFGAAAVGTAAVGAAAAAPPLRPTTLPPPPSGKRDRSELNLGVLDQNRTTPVGRRLDGRGTRRWPPQQPDAAALEEPVVIAMIDTDAAPELDEEAEDEAMEIITGASADDTQLLRTW